MDIFDMLAKGELSELATALETDPSLAASKHASGASLLAWAFYVGQPGAVTLIRPHLGALSPHDAIIVGDADRLRDSIAAGWDANTLSPDGFTPLGLAAFFNRPEIFDVLLPLTRDVNEKAKNPQQVAAIHAATAMRAVDLVEKLLLAGADPDLTQSDGFTPLHAAAQHGDTRTAGLLLLAGADSGLRNAKSEDAAHFARAAGHEWLANRLEALAAAKS